MYTHTGWILRGIAIAVLGVGLFGQGCPTGGMTDGPPTLENISIPAQAGVNESVPASADIDDAEGQIRLRVDWGDGTVDESAPGDARTETLSHAYAAAGTFTVTLTAIDDAGQSSTPATTQITIAAPVNQPPTLGGVGLSRGRNAGSAVGAIAQIADPEDQVLLRIDWGDGHIEETPLGFSRTLTLTHVYASAGTFAVTFTAIDDANQASEPQTLSVTVAPLDDPNVDQPPLLGAVSVDSASQVGLIVTASAELLDAEHAVRLRVHWGDGTSDESASGLSRTQSLAHQYTATGTFSVVFTAVDDSGQTSVSKVAQTTISPFTGENQPPTLGNVSLTPQANSGEAVTATAQLNDAENQVRLRIDWGDGNVEDSAAGPSRPVSLTHLYAADGTYKVTFTAIDGADQPSAPKTAETTVLPTDQIVNTSNSIITEPGGTRNDPEGVAAPAQVTRITWRDSRDAERTLVLGPYLYQYDFTFSDNTQIITRSANDDAFGHPGFGYVVSHNSVNGNSPLGKANVPTSVTTTVFDGGHHAIHRVELLYDRDAEAGGNGIKIPVIIEWLVATGRDHPVWAVTWRTGEAENPNNIDFDVYRMDVRGPYGSLNFDGAANANAGDAIGGVAWGDSGLMFTTTDAQLTLNSPWTYNTPNTVNFSHIWTVAVNAEMGIVQTRPLDKEMGYGDRVVGRERGNTSADNFTDKGDCNAFGDNRNYLMPCIGGWPYQLMNFDWDPGTGKDPDEPTGTKLIAWGSPYGWLGASSFDLFDGSDQADGRGDRSYATFIVLGPKCRFAGGVCDQPGDVALTIAAVEALAAADISNIGPGSLAEQLPRGPGAQQVKDVEEGYNDTYAAYYINATLNQARFTFTLAPGMPVTNPIFVIRNYTTTAVPTITVDGVAITVNTGTADAGAFVSLNAARNELWVTLNRTLTAATTVDLAR